MKNNRIYPLPHNYEAFNPIFANLETKINTNGTLDCVPFVSYCKKYYFNNVRLF